MATCSTLLSSGRVKGWSPLVHRKEKYNVDEWANWSQSPSRNSRVSRCNACCFLGVTASNDIGYPQIDATMIGDASIVFGVVGNINLTIPVGSAVASDFIDKLLLADVDPASRCLRFYR
ncbi:hypothetical protein HS088_TW05G00133 [Tripterygium wilfordii]|uniref:Uncharacterized protein n=1 Tax=Tripterygium wilfordii TaxID=458696 RepID=A0A7J7DM09_TRIWF|nr:hypothetical protein HS088_TW05G00133 [Tripterygium wilfordii]